MDEALTSELQKANFEDSMDSDSVTVEFRQEDLQDESSLNNIHRATSGSELSVLDTSCCTALNASMIAEYRENCKIFCSINLMPSY